jgi:hypothetical protein
MNPEMTGILAVTSLTFTLYILYSCLQPVIFSLLWDAYREQSKKVIFILLACWIFNTNYRFSYHMNHSGETTSRAFAQQAEDCVFKFQPHQIEVLLHQALGI